MDRDLMRFYDILGKLQDRIGQRMLKDCHGRLSWPRRGVYFFFEAGEFRPNGTTPRVVRVGTHAVSVGSRTTLWNRLSNHRGTLAGGGNHRGSIFRLWVGAALLNSDASIDPKPTTWEQGASAKRPVLDAEAHVEQAVSTYIGLMPFLWINADDEPRTDSVRSVIEKNALALLSCSSETGSTTDRPSPGWLGHHCPKEKLRCSGLWNVKDVDGRYDPKFLDVFAQCAAQTDPL